MKREAVSSQIDTFREFNIFQNRLKNIPDQIRRKGKDFVLQKSSLELIVLLFTDVISENLVRAIIKIIRRLKFCG